jgi:hypothetical protein
MNFNPANKEHRAIVLGAMAAADALGTGRLTAAREQLELNDITIADEEQFRRHVFAWGEGFQGFGGLKFAERSAP